MQLTELRIAGFKSFVDPEAVPIRAGLTGIVGPNGCGKSNLLEALRWAMGATSARAMRGGEMDDLIFSGSAGRPARELAEVTLVLDNSDRKAPAEFNASDTLEVLRRLKRGSGSTYKINGRTVRGKDVKLLFADASTGANSPSLVRQGQISELIGSKPQNRRRILEEAAGIGGLNTRRHESELKLRAAETNLERLSEVSAEVERQLESLKRQARKAKKYKELSEQIIAFEAYLAHLRWSAAKHDREDAAIRLAKAKSEVERFTREAAIKEAERVKVSDGLQDLRSAEAISAGKLGQAKISLARLETEYDNAAKMLASVEREAERLKEEVEHQSSIREEAERMLQEARESLAALPVADDTTNKQKELELSAALSGARDTLKLAQDRADAVAEDLSTKRAEIQASLANANAHRTRKERLEAELQKAEAVLADLPQQGDLTTKLETAKQEELQAATALAELNAALLETEQAVEEAIKIEQSAQRPKNEAQDSLRALETEISGLNRLLRKSATPKSPPVLDQIRTRDGYEKAVAIALGDDLQAPIDRSADIYWAGSDADVQPLPQGAEPLSRYVEAPGELAACLSQCGVVSATDGEALAAHLKPGQRLVTVQGHLWRWDGFTKTPSAPAAAAERLEQQARLEDAQAQIGLARSSASEAETRYAEARASKMLSEDRLKEIRRDISSASDTLNTARKSASAAQQTLDWASMKRDGAEETVARIRTDFEIARDALETVEKPSRQDDLSELESNLATAKSDLQHARDKETEARGRLADLTRNREQAMARRSALEQDVERWTKRLGSSEARVDDLLKRRSAAAQEALKGKDRPQELVSELQTLRARIDTLEMERAAASDRLAEREAAIRDIESEAKSSANLAMSARETLAISNAQLANANTRFEEAEQKAQAQFQRTPEGLITLARPVLDEVGEGLDPPNENDSERQLDFLRRDRENLGGVNMEAEAEAEAMATRLGTQAEEKADLTSAIEKLREGIKALNKEGRDRLMVAFEQVNTHFKSLFTTLFRGGEAELRLVDADDPLAAGLEIFAQPPGKRLGTLSLMSGGEQALTATALIFAVFLSRPSPICVLDEVDAPLDDANVDRYCRMLDEMRERTDTRFIVITHNAVTMSRMDRLYGVTMREKGVSKLVSVDLETAEDLVAAE